MKNSCNLKILVVEDEPIILENLLKKIRDIGDPFEISGSAYNGQEAIAVIENRKPDILITDIRMPIIDGLELIKHVFLKYPDIRIIIISGYGEFEYAQRALKYGVKEYLLKPVSTSALAEALQKVASEIQLEIQLAETSSLIYQFSATTVTSVPCSLKTSHFFIYLICLGNKYNLNSDNPPQPYSNPWETILHQQLVPAGEEIKMNKFWVIDEKSFNEKFVIIQFEQKHEDKIIRFMEQLLSNLKACTKCVPVTICTTDKLIQFTNLFHEAQAIRSHLNKNIIPWSSNLLLLETSLTKVFPAISINKVIENKINNFIQTESKNLLKKQLEELFHNWEKSAYTQVAFEKELFQLIRLLCLASNCLSDAEIYHIEWEFQENIFTSDSMNSFFEFFWRTFENAFFIHNKEGESSKELIDSIANYIYTNFTQPLSFFSIAKKFNINPSHLTRMFKRYYRDTPLKYLINLRIEEAKKLIEDKPEMDFKNIAEIVGYPDQHYFSKIFKKITGKTPSEYRVGKS